jgi:hypothetical protein
MAVFTFAITREQRETLSWRVVEVAMHGSQLYL